MTSDMDIQTGMIGHGHISPFTGVPGWLTEHEQGVLLILGNAISWKTFRTIVEIGSELGQSASLLARYCHSANMICVDINEEAPFEHNLALLDIAVNAIYQRSQTLDWEQTARALKIPKWIDLLFIDGEHSEVGVRGDLDNFARYINDDGYLVLHDCACSTNKMPHQQHYWVTAALQHWLAQYGHQNGFRHLFSVDSMMVYRRMSNGN